MAVLGVVKGYVVRPCVERGFGANGDLGESFGLSGDGMGVHKETLHLSRRQIDVTDKIDSEI